MSYTVKTTTPSGNRGSHYNRDGDYVYYVNEPAGEIWRQPVNPVSMMIQSTTTLTFGKTVNLNGQGVIDVRWTGAVIQGQNGAKLIALTDVTSLDEIPPDALIDRDWNAVAANNALPENGQSTAGNLYAVRISVSPTEQHYAKVRVHRDTATRIEWVSYNASSSPQSVGAGYSGLRDIVVSPYEDEIYVSGADANGGYVARFDRLVAGAHPKYDDQPNPLLSDALVEPQQIVVVDSVIYVVAQDGLYRIDANTSMQDKVVTGIAAPVGLLLDIQGSVIKAIISDETGNVYIVDVTEFSPSQFNSIGQFLPPSAPISAPEASCSLGGPSGFLTWADEVHSGFYATVRSSGEVKRVELASLDVSTEATALASPWSVEALGECHVLVIGEGEIGEIERCIPVTAALLLGIGLIPFGYINKSTPIPASLAQNDGKANTSSAPGYYFSAHPNLAFAENLSLMLNHDLAWNSDIRFYRVSVHNMDTGASRTIGDQYVDMRWNATAKPPKFEPVSTVPSGGMFPIRNPSDLWYNPFLSAILRTAFADNGHNRLRVEFFDAQKKLIPGGVYERLVYIDNTRTNGLISLARIGTAITPPAPNVYPTLDCGAIVYASKDDLIELDFKAWHPQGIGTYTVVFHRGNTLLFSVSGNATETPEIIAITERSPGVPLRVGHLTGNCDMANVSVRLSVPARAINGFGWVNLGTSISRSFTLVNSLTHTTWP